MYMFAFKSSYTWNGIHLERSMIILMTSWNSILKLRTVTFVSGASWENDDATLPSASWIKTFLRGQQLRQQSNGPSIALSCTASLSPPALTRPKWASPGCWGCRWSWAPAHGSSSGSRGPGLPSARTGCSGSRWRPRRWRSSGAAGSDDVCTSACGCRESGPDTGWTAGGQSSRPGGRRLAGGARGRRGEKEEESQSKAAVQWQKKVNPIFIKLNGH